MIEDGNEEEKERKKQIEEELKSFRQCVSVFAALRGLQ